MKTKTRGCRSTNPAAPMGIPAMTDTKELLQRITALRARLHEGAEPTSSAPDRLSAIEDKVQRGAVHNSLIESALRSTDPREPDATPTLRLTGRGARLLRRGRDLLQALRTIANDPAFQDATELAPVHREGMAMIEVVLRTVQGMPASVSAQLRMCDGLEVVLAEVDERIGVIHRGLAQRKQSTVRIDELADYLRCLATDRPVGLAQLQAQADLILAEATAGQPLRLLYATPDDPSRFAAAHSLTVAQVLARLILNDSEWQPHAQLAVMAALVHDVGMTRVPGEALMPAGPLDADQRRLVEKHVTVAAAMLEQLWPGGGWPVEAATCHHERTDGTGYPLGQQEMQLAAFVRLLAVCDVYAALCCPRPHRAALDTRTALTETLLMAERRYLDQAAAERLLLLSFYPVGSIVELNDGAVGQVIATHPGPVGMTHPDRPIVHLTSDADGNPVDWPIVIDLLEHKDRSILRGLHSEKSVGTLIYADSR